MVVVLMKLSSDMAERHHIIDRPLSIEAHHMGKSVAGEESKQASRWGSKALAVGG